MRNKDEKKLMGIIWLITDIIILICAVMLLMQGGTLNIAVATIGIIVVAVEFVLYRKGRLFN